MKKNIYKCGISFLILCIFLINIDNIFLCTRLDSIKIFNNSTDIDKKEIVSSLNYFDNGKNINIESIIKDENSTLYRISLKGREGIHEINEILKNNKSLEIHEIETICHRDGEFEGRVEIIE